MNAFSLQQDAEPPVAEAAPFRRQAPQPRAHVAVARLGLPAHGLGIDPDQLAGAPLRKPALGHQAEHGFPARREPGQFFPRRPFSAATSSIDMDVSDAKRLKALEDENAKLKKLLADLLGLSISRLRCLKKPWGRGSVTWRRP